MANESELRFESSAPEETEALGRCLSRLVPLGQLVALYGELATGKTCLVRAMAERYARGELVTSPTFTIVNEYGDSPKLFHLDLYRITDVREILDLGYEELFEPSDGVTVVEWAERAETLLPAKRLDVHLEHGGGDIRRIVVRDRGVLAAGWRDAVSEEVARQV